MEDIIFRPKYKITLWLHVVILLLSAIFSLVLAVSMFGTYFYFFYLFCFCRLCTSFGGRKKKSGKRLVRSFELKDQK